MHRKRRETPYTVCHVPADAALSFTALVIITIKTHSKLPIHPKVRKQDLVRKKNLSQIVGTKLVTIFLTLSVNFIFSLIFLQNVIWS